MGYIQIDTVISQMVSFFYCIGFWHRGIKATAGELRTKIFFCIYHLLFFVSLVIGAILCGSIGEAIYLLESSIAIIGLNFKLWALIWKQDQIVDLLNRICRFFIRYEEDEASISCKLKKFRKFAIICCILALFACLEVSLVPFIVNEKFLVFEIGFPLDYKNSEIAFWIANTFVFTECALSIMVMCYSMIIWYLLLSCSLRYESLGYDLKKTGTGRIGDGNNDEISEIQKQSIFIQDLNGSVAVHLHLRGLINELESFLSNRFIFLLGTSGLCICGSVYCLAFNVGESLSKRCVHLLALYYFISDLFMTTYFGNEIMLSSDRLSYRLFESDWVEQPQVTKKNIIIFGEYLRQPHELVIGKLYPLTLETFTRILNSAYSMFNILKSFQK